MLDGSQDYSNQKELVEMSSCSVCAEEKSAYKGERWREVEKRVESSLQENWVEGKVPKRQSAL